MAIPASVRRAAEQHLRTYDRALRGVMERVGPFTLRPERKRFSMLVHSIVAQQISAAAAISIWRRVESLMGEPGVVPGELAAKTDDQLRQAGISPQKLRYVRDLTEKTLAGVVRFERHGRMHDDAVVAELVQVTGVGVWTAQMFLIFALGRLDVLPCADLGLRTAMQRLYGLAQLPNARQCEEIAAPWRPYASVASWYCWRSLEKTRETPAKSRKTRSNPPK